VNKEEALSKLKDIIRPYITDPALFENLSESSDLMKDLKINSAHLIDIILDTEEAFNIQIDDESMEKLRTVGDALALVQSKSST
jgi:acyl carrier protein